MHNRIAVNEHMGLQALWKNPRQRCYSLLCFLLLPCSVATVWNGLKVITYSEAPGLVVTSGSMEPTIDVGDIIIIDNNLGTPIRAGDIVVFRLKGREIPIVHRVVQAREGRDQELKFLTKGDNNSIDDTGLYPRGQRWIQREAILGRVRFVIPKIGHFTIFMRNLLVSLPLPIPLSFLDFPEL